MHDGSVLRFRSLPEGYDPSDRSSVEEYLRDRQARGEIATGVLYLNESSVDLHELNQTPSTGLEPRPVQRALPRLRGVGDTARGVPLNDRREDAPEPLGGESACYAHLVCTTCGAVSDPAHATTCGVDQDVDANQFIDVVRDRSTF